MGADGPTDTGAARERRAVPSGIVCDRVSKRTAEAEQKIFRSCKQWAMQVKRSIKH